MTHLGIVAPCSGIQTLLVFLNPKKGGKKSQRVFWKEGTKTREEKYAHSKQKS
jgi:hypothetical protein